MTKLGRAMAKQWMTKASRQELFEVMDEAMLSPLQQEIIMLRRKDTSIVKVSLAEKYSISKINKEIAKARENVIHTLKAMGRIKTL